MAQKKRIQLKTLVTFEDFKKHNTYHQKKIIYSYFLIAFVLFFYLCTTVFSGSWVLIFIFSTIISAVPAGLLTLILKVMLKIKVKREYYSDQLIQKELHYIIDRDGIEQKLNRSNLYLEWDNFVKVYEHHDMFRLYLSKTKALVIPKRSFKSAEDLVLFKELLKEKIDDKKLKLTLSL